MDASFLIPCILLAAVAWKFFGGSAYDEERARDQRNDLLDEATRRMQ